MFRKGIIVVLGVLLLPLFLRAEEEAESKILVYDNPQLAAEVMMVENKKQLLEFTESFLEIIGSYHRVEASTVLPVASAYLQTLERLRDSVEEVGFGALLESEEVDLELEARLEPLKQELLSYLAQSTLVTYVTKQEVYYSSKILRTIVESGELSFENQRALVEMVLGIHADLKQNVNRFLMKRVVKPIVAENEVLRAELKEKFGRDIIEENLFSQEELALEILAQMFPKGKMGSREAKSIDLVEAREGIVEGKVERDPTKRRLSKERNMRQRARANARR